jgi:hypothetical protein
VVVVVVAGRLAGRQGADWVFGWLSGGGVPQHDGSPGSWDLPGGLLVLLPPLNC